MAKKVIYKITKTTYEIVEVETPEQEALIAELNRDTEREEKRTQVNKVRCRSLEQMREEEGFEPADASLSWIEQQIQLEEMSQIEKDALSAIRRLTKRQREIVILIFYKGKSQSETAKILHVTEPNVSITLERAKANLKKMLEKYSGIF